MGTIKDGINGPFRGKTGNVVGSKWRKVNYIKGLPHFKSNRAASANQLLVRRKFALLNRFFDPISTVLEIGFKQFTSRATGKNVAIRYNYDHAFLIDGSAIALDFPALQFSHGSLFTAGDEQARVIGDNLYITWDPETYGMGRSMDDRAYIILYEEIREVFFTVGRPLRHEGAVQFMNPILTLRPLKLHLWLFFAERAGKQVSRTVYIPIADPES